jgi:hypothetical protein
MKTHVIAVGFFYFFLNLSNVYAWDFGFKADAQKNYTDNVNLTNVNPIADSYNVLGGYAQFKNADYRIRLKAKMEKYQKQDENSNYTTELGLQYKHTKTQVYDISVFNQVYNGTPTVSTDTTSDNKGARVAAAFTNNFDKDTSGYISLNGTLKNYTKIQGRKDKLFGAAVGIEHYLTPGFLINPEVNILSNSSTDSYYKNTAYGPSLLASYSPNDNWEFFADGSYTYTLYSDRSITSIVKGKTVTRKEYQELKNAEVGTIYSFERFVTLQAKYSTGKNNSNNSASAYSANVTSLGISFKY